MQENKQKIDSYDYLNSKTKRGKINNNKNEKRISINQELYNNNENEEFYIKNEENSKFDNHILNRSRRQIKNKYINDSINIPLNEENDEKDISLLEENNIPVQKNSRKKNRIGKNTHRIKSRSINLNKKRNGNVNFNYKKGKTNKYIIYFNPYSILINKKLFESENEPQTLPDELRFIIIEKSKLDMDLINN